MKLPEGLSASCAVGETRGAMVGDQSLRKAVKGGVDLISARRYSTGQRASWKRMAGRCTASQMAAASAASFLPRTPLMR
jgi:hypothetical protein